MAVHIFTFGDPTIDFNTSLQLGDIVYYCPTAQVGGFDTADELTQGGSQIIRLGVAARIDTRIISGNNPNRISRLYVDDENIAPTMQLEGVDGFLMFSKDNKVNLSNVSGYYASVTLVNNTSDDTHPELFAVSTEITQSSK